MQFILVLLVNFFTIQINIFYIFYTYCKQLLMNCFGYFCLIFILSFIRLASSSELTFERLSKLYAKYIFHSDEQMPLDKRILLRHRLTSEHLLRLVDQIMENIFNLLAEKINESVTKSKREIIEENANINYNYNKNEHKSVGESAKKGNKNKKVMEKQENKKEKKRECKETEMNKGKAKKELEEGMLTKSEEKLSDGHEGINEGLLLLDFFVDLQQDNEQLTAPFQQEKVRLVDICHYRSFYFHLQFVLDIVNGNRTPKTGGNGLKYCWKVLAKGGKFQRDEKCDRIEAISSGKDGRDEGEQKWLKVFDQEMAGVHLNCLHRLLQDSTPNSNRKVTALFEGGRGDEENVFVHTLRLVALGSKKLAEQMLTQVQHRLFELVGQNKQMVDELKLNWPILLNGIDMMAWLQLFYTNVLMPNSAPTRRKAVIKLNFFAYIQSIDEFHRQNERIRDDWCQLRKEMAKMIDSLDTKIIDSVFENQMNSWLSILYLLKKEIKSEQYTVLNREWSVVNINENNKKGMIGDMVGHDWEKAQKLLLNIRDDLTQMHYATLEKFIETRMDFRQTFQEMSGVQLVHRLDAILGGDDPAKAVKLIRKCRQIEGVTKWFLAVHKPQFEQCSTTFNDNYQDSKAVSLSRSYEQLLLDADLFKNQFEFAHAFYSKPIVVDALLWLFSTLVDDLLMFVDGMFGLESGGYGIPLQRDTVVRDLWTTWARLLLEDENAEKSKKVKLCRIYSFLGMAIYKIGLQMCSAESDDFFAFLNKIRWDRFKHAMAWLNWSNNINVVPICNEDEAEKLFTELTQKQNFGLLHTRTIYTLMKRSKRLSNFFCFHAENIAFTKDRLLMLVNSTANLDWLEMKFPEILKIGVINSRHRIFLYQSILSNRSESRIAQRSKARIVVPFLFEELNTRYQFCFDYEDPSKMQINDDVVNPMWDQFWLSIYPEMDTMKGICLAMFMLQFVDGLAESIAASPSDQQIEDCIGQRARLKQFQRYWELVEQKHLDFLLNGILSGCTILKLFPEGEFPDGTRPRLNKLLGTKLFTAFWHQFGDDIIDKQLFVNDIKLMDNYLATLFHQIENVDRFAHKISADIIVFVRWLDAQPRGDKFDKIWQETKKFRLEPFYTSFYEENLDDKFRSRIHFLGELFDGIKSVLNKCRNLGIEKKLRQEWVGMEKRALKENLRWMASDARGNAVMPKWIMKLHAKTLHKLAFGSAEKGNEKTDVLAKQFKKKLKTGLCQSLDAKHRLLNFLEIEDIKEIFEKLEIEFNVKDFEDDPMDEDEQTNCSDQTEKEKSKNKKKKNKNRKKKSGKGRESVQNEESEREKMQRLEQIEVKPIKEQTKTETEKPKDLSKSNETIETRVKSEMDSDQQMFLAQPLKNGVDQIPEFDAEYDFLSIMKEPLGGMTKIAIRDLKEDNFLLGKYLELMADPNKFCTNTVDSILVELSVFANEIWRRIESIGHFQQNAKKLGSFLFPKKMVEIWSKLESEGQVEKDKTKMRKFGLILFRILKVVVIGGTVNNNGQSMPRNQHNPTSDRNKIMNVNNDLDKVGNVANDRNVIINGRDIHKTDKMKNESNDRNKINEIFGIREQLHRNNFARLISSNERARNAWSSLTEDGQFYAITVLLGGRRKDGKKYGNVRAQFLKYLAKWEKTRAQLELDKQIFSQFNNFSKYSSQILGNFVENMQQIKFSIQTDLETNSLINILRENGFYVLEKLKENQIREEFGKIKATVTKWSAGTGILLLSGSTVLKAQTADSDIDTICIVPGHIHSDSFFGTLQCLDANERHNCDDNSLFCMLCQLPEVHSLRRLPETLVPLIRLISSFGHNFEIVFASIPDIHKISMTEVNGSRERICEMTHKLATKVKEGNLKEGEIVKTERMVRSLAAYHSNLMIAEMVPNIETFRIFVLTLKMWAKNNFIYNNVLGFLHGMPLYVLAAKICIMYPNANVPFLLERFFLTYSLWEWPMPVQLAEVRPDLLAWSAEKEQDKRIFLFGVGLYSQLSMPIITPGYPAHNSTFNVNWFTAKIIQKAMQEAFEQLQSSSANGTKWEKLLLQRRTFSDMYEHSFAINCAASSWDLCEEFCGFVGTRIRVQLMKSVECVRGEVNFCHARSVDDCPEHILHRYKARSHKASCKAWLVGIDLKRSVLPDGNEAAPPMSSKSKAQTDQNLKLDIVEPIVDSYRRVVLGELRWAGVGDHQQTNQQRPPLFLEAKKIKIKKFFEKTKNFESWQETELGTDFVHLESKYVEREELRERWSE